MTKEEILKTARPILFNTDMVKAILDGRKTMTRRVIKPQPTHPRWNCIGWLGFDDGHGYKMRQPCDVGDILYVRETWLYLCGNYEYKADGKHLALNAIVGHEFFKWKPSIHMPKAAARIFLRVTGVRVERLQDITPEQALREGALKDPFDNAESDFSVHSFRLIWDSTIKATDISKYGWDANPWVWVIEFERVEE